MKALAGLFGVAFAVFLMFAVVGQPTYSGSDGTTVSYSGLTLFDSWMNADNQKTERVRIAEAQETQRVMYEQEQATIRNRDFWQTFPFVVLSLSALAGAVGFAFVGVAWSKRPPAPRHITHVTHNNLTVQQPVADLTQWNTDGLPPLPTRRITVSRR